jgi:hypothetical protein
MPQVTSTDAHHVWFNENGEGPIVHNCSKGAPAMAAYIRTWAASKKLRGLAPDAVVDVLLELADDVEATA